MRLHWTYILTFFPVPRHSNWVHLNADSCWMLASCWLEESQSEGKTIGKSNASQNVLVDRIVTQLKWSSKKSILPWCRIERFKHWYFYRLQWLCSSFDVSSQPFCQTFETETMQPCFINPVEMVFTPAYFSTAMSDLVIRAGTEYMQRGNPTQNTDMFST